MCLHPPALKCSLGYDELNREIEKRLYHNELNDNCDYTDPGLKTELNKTDLCVIQLNVRGLMGKIWEINRLLHENHGKKKPDIIICSETWLKLPAKDVRLDGYEFIGNNRKNKKGGGVGIFVLNTLKHKVRKDLHVESKCMENITTEIMCNRKNIVVGSIYRPPNTNHSEFMDHYTELIRKIKNENKEIILGMDHNLDFLKSEIHKPTAMFIARNLEHDLISCITRPTRITKTSATLIDNIFIDRKYQEVYKSDVLLDNISDHLPCRVIITDRLIRKKMNKKITTRDTRKSRIDNLKVELEKENWSVDENKDINECCNVLHNKLSRLAEEHLPVITKNVSSQRYRREPWLSEGIMKCIVKCKKYYKLSIMKNATDKIIDRYRSYRNTLNTIKRRSKINYYQKSCIEHKKNTSKLWQIINNVINKVNDKGCVIERLKINNMLVNEPKKISNHLGEYFSTVGENYANKIASPKRNIDYYLGKINNNIKTIFMEPTSQCEVLKIINSLPSKKSSGYDGISNVVLKEIAPTILNPLTTMFNMSLTQGIFPDCMKLAEIIALHKSKNRELCDNYRPISLLITISKVLEKIVYKRVYKFLNTTNQIYEKQYGFRAKHSCENAVSNLVGDLVKNIQDKKYTITLFLDLSKAFDTLEHRVIFDKMYKYGIRGTTLNWFKSYLTNRQLRVKINAGEHGTNIISDKYPVTYGTPQGSCLGPLIFLIFCNDLSNSLMHSNCIQFADDTTIYCSSKDLRYLRWQIMEDLKNASDWLKANKLTLNLNKTNYMIFSPKSNEKLNMAILFENIALPRVHNTKFLGIWIDDQLNWKCHMTHLHLKLKSNLGLLRKAKNLLPPSIKVILYYAQIFSHLNYGILCWGSMARVSDKQLIEKVQNQCVRIINPKYKTSIIYKTYSLLKLTDLIDLTNWKFAHQFEQDSLPRKIMKTILYDHKNNSLIKSHSYKTRNKNIPNLPRATHKLYRSSYLYQSLLRYSKLPNNIKQISNHNSFVKACKNHLLNANLTN